MPEYINHQKHFVSLSGPDGRLVKIKPGQKVELSSYFDRYVRQDGSGQLVKVNPTTRPKPIPILFKKQVVKSNQQTNSSVPVSKVIKRINQNKRSEAPRKTVGIKTANEHVLKHHPIVNSSQYNISNNIGVGILSRNRKHSLERLIQSIQKYTDLTKTIVFISDDASDDQELLNYLDSLTTQFVVLKNSTRLGVAGNTNRLMRCLERFENCLLLNDDTQVLRHGWENFYKDAALKSRMHHFMRQEPGVYGSTTGDIVEINRVQLLRTNHKPHGAILSYTNKLFNTIGYFDEKYGLYGMEHVDWSTRASVIQEPGYYDVPGSDKYFKIHNDKSSINNKSELLTHARSVYGNGPQERYIKSSSYTDIPAISYVIPVQVFDRLESLGTVINSIRGQLFPIIDIIVSEFNAYQTLSDIYYPTKYKFTKCNNSEPFNKSMAFNAGVSSVRTNNVILHDADLVPNCNYTSKVYDLLNRYNALHIGGQVVYLNKESTNLANSSGKIDKDMACERAVGYFEGGSLACNTKTYWDVGGFNEDFKGYGNEDTEFYGRLSKSNKFISDRTELFIHLYHGRTDGWMEYHRINKLIESKLEALPMVDRISKLRQQNIKYESLINT